MEFKILLESSYAWFLKYPVFIQFALVMIVLSIVLFLVANVSLVLDRITTSSRELRIQRASKLISTELTDSLMMEDEMSELNFNMLVKRIKEVVITNKLVKQVVIDQIIFYHRNFTDHTERLLTKLFLKLNLVDSSIQKVKNGTWELKAKGLREMQEMTLSQTMNQFIDPLLNDKNHDLRIEAQATYIRINKDNPFRFLMDATEELLEWHQILLYELITNTPDLAKPNINAYLKSKNSSVVSFSVKLVVYYHLLEAIPVLISLLDHPVQKIREEVVVALGSLNVEEAEIRMIEKYPMEDLKVQLRILTSLGEIGSGNQLNFLKKQFLKSDEFTIMKTAGCALAVYPAFNKQEILNETNEISSWRETILHHCTNTLIRN